MRKWISPIVVLLTLLPLAALAQDKNFRLSAPPALIESGLLRHMVPRFSLKTSIRIAVVESGAAQVRFSAGGSGRAVFQGAGETWHMAFDETHPGAKRFADWMLSDVGTRTLTSYKIDGEQAFDRPKAKETVKVVLRFDGDAEKGMELSHTLCGRCHVVSERNRMNAIGSTPSFQVLRSLGDWDDRFQTFFALNPHPAFTQVEDVTDPFPINRPSPIVPVEMTLDDLEAIIAYVNAMEPADLGAPVQHQ